MIEYGDDLYDEDYELCSHHISKNGICQICEEEVKEK